MRRYRYIKNAHALQSKGNAQGRMLAIDILEHAMESLDSYNAVQRLVRVRGKELVVGNLKLDLGKVRNIYVVGAGKASLSMVRAVHRVLGSRIKGGAVVVKRGQVNRTTRYGAIRVFPASHPVPDAAGREGAREVLKIADKAGKGDVVFALISGGASALLPVPAGGISLKDKMATTRLLLDLGISVDEINTVRNHISGIKGGRLALRIHPAELFNLIIVDQLRPLPWGPTVSDPTTAGEAIAILRRYGVWKKTPESVRLHLLRVSKNLEPETPKEKDLAKVKLHNFILGDNPAICAAAKRRAEELGMEAVVLTSELEGESADAGIVLASIAKRMEEEGPGRRPRALIAGGETTVRLAGGRHGTGGPSQELALGSAFKIRGSKRIVLAAVDTDGTDGPTDVAGAIVDGYTIDRALEKKIDPRRSLLEHDSGFVLSELGDTIRMGLTGTNVMDLNLVIVG